jgi:hypothetical protein
MTTGIVLGTGANEETVYRAANAVGFNPVDSQVKFQRHRELPDLGLQINPLPAYFRGVKGVNTEIEFDDYGDKYPDNPKAVSILKEMYALLPDLRYRDQFCSVANPSPINSVADLVAAKK